MNPIKESIYQTIDQLNEDEQLQVLQFAQHLKKKNSIPQVETFLVDDPAVKLPTKGIDVFKQVKPVYGHGLPASELLLKDRR